MLRDVPDQVLLAELRRRAAEDTVQREEIRRLLAELRLEEIRRQAANAQQLLQDLRERQRLLEGVESLKDVQDGVKPVVESLKDDKPLSAKAHTGLCYRARRAASLKKAKSMSLATVESEENGCVAWL